MVSFLYGENMKKLVYFLAAMLLTGCSREFIESLYGVNYEPTNRFAKNLAELPGQFEKDTKALDALIGSFSGNIQKRWGSKEIKIAGKSNYVKYIDNYLSRSEVNFSKGTITVETVSPTDPKGHLRNAIITTLLTPDDPSSVDLFSSKSINLKANHFFIIKSSIKNKNPFNGHGAPIASQTTLLPRSSKQRTLTSKKRIT